MELNPVINNITSESLAIDKGWQAELELKFNVKADRTILQKRRSIGPLVVQRPFYPEDGVCHVYILHPPGGVVGGDKLTTTIYVEKNASALLTTPGASKLYRSSRNYSKQNNILNINDGTLEWFPQECIAFSGARAFNQTKVYLTKQARFIGWEILCLGRPAAKETFEKGDINMRFDLWRDNKPLLFDNLKLSGADDLLTAPWGLRSFSCSGTFIASGVEQSLLEAIREEIIVKSDALVGLTRIEDILVCRYLGHQAEQAKTYFTKLWHYLRKTVIGKHVSEPRIWTT